MLFLWLVDVVGGLLVGCLKGWTGDLVNGWEFVYWLVAGWLSE